MKFSEYKYERPDYEAVSKKLNGLMDELEKQNEAKAFYDVFLEIEKIDEHIDSMRNIANIRHSINTVDKFYMDESEYWDEYNPMYSALSNRLSSIVLAFKDREALTKYIPETYFMIAECEVKAFDEKIIPLMQKENKLVSEYDKLKATAKIEFEGQTYNLASIGKLTESDDRETRRKAYKAKMSFYAKNEDEFDRIYDELVKVRTEMARQLGYENFTELGYYRMNRLDYNQEMVANYREQILNEMVPLANELYERQAKRLGLDKLEIYDVNYKFSNGNPIPKGTAEELVKKAVDMYHSLSKETGEFIDVMNESELWDLISRDNKEMGGYCACIEEQKVPFIFANFNGTSGDVDVLTHEAGHGFQYYMSKEIPVAACCWPTMESCEIHSMSMEFFSYPWMDQFFKEDKNKYYYSHVGGTVEFLPYGVLIDHFQHEVYNHPEMTPDERKATWRRLEKMYQPHKDYSECEILEKGCWWFQQGHVFQVPFYYIDYTLAQVCAMQFFVRTLKNDENAWKDYVHLCKLGGTLPFTKLVKEAGLIVPFENGCVSSITDTLRDYLSNIDDENL